MGPLTGLKVVEIAGIGPAPFCAMLLSDLGAEVLRIDRVEPAEKGVAIDPRLDLFNRGRRSIAVNLKSPEGVSAVLRLAGQADALIEGFRPGVMERLGLGPDACLARNPRLVYGRMTGYGQYGPLSQAAGHDINYIGVAGVLHCIGRRGGIPVPPHNFIGDLGGGALYLAFGLMAAIYEVRRSGKGQVVDAAMTDGAASLNTFSYALLASGDWSDTLGGNLLDSGRPWYDVYPTLDNKYVAIGSIEPRFYKELMSKLGLDLEALPRQHDPHGWDRMREVLTRTFRTKTRDEWCRLLDGTDVCFSPVLSPAEAVNHPHNVARQTFTEVAGVIQPAPAPRFSRTPGCIQAPPAKPGEHTSSALADWSFSESEIAALQASGAIA
ncbi:MAG TPA: CaiB/BaiF CoA-transferase family protein [Ramlibacter sp.]|nr:CaiB/BaiF CoA-transferase family protein [Ramlibacter sp.]